ncbi:MAG: DUF2070 family protein [Candidatus Micrarchaeia archaeon]
MRKTDSVTRYSKYFKIEAPSTIAQAAVLLLIGVAAGVLSIAIAHYGMPLLLDYRLLTIGAVIGIMSISMPALLTVLFIKAINWRMQLKHAMLSTTMIAMFYALAFVVVSVAFAASRSVAISYAILLASNAGIYGYWFVMGNVVMGIRKRGAALTSATQPVLDVLFFLPFSVYLLGVDFPLNITLLKLLIGMLIFLAAGYAFLYAVDRPTRKLLGSSGVKVMSSMLSYWLYNFSADTQLIGERAAVRRNAEVDVVAIKGKGNNDGGYAAVFVNPDMHFGPFANAGGSVATEYMGSRIVKAYGAAPFVLHSTVNIEDNPVGSSQVFSMAKKIFPGSHIGAHFKPAMGSVSFGSQGKCRAIDIKLSDTRIILLSKAPYVTEDIARPVGMELKAFAERKLHNGRVLLVDAHNSRFESAPKDELKGVNEGSAYVEDYKKAIEKAIAGERNLKLEMGFAYRRLGDLVGKHKDIGNGYTSVCVMRYGSTRFCLVYFDANNMLPGFRKEVIEHIRDKFNMQAELCTTDTHSINLLSEDAGNALGRHTKPIEVIPALDLLIGYAMGNMERVQCAHNHYTIENFEVWGPNASERIEQTGKEIRNIVKRVTPFIIIAAFVIAAWLVSFV